MMPYNLRDATEADIAVVTVLESASFKDPMSATLLRAELQIPNNYFKMLVSQNDIAIGYIIFRTILDEAELMRLAIDPEYRQQRYATVLLAHMLDRIRILEVKKVFLEVRESNSGAIALYKKFNFQGVWVRRNYYSAYANDNALIMCLDLQDNAP